MEIKERIENAANKIDVLNEDNISEIDSFDLEYEIKKNEDLKEVLKNIANDLIKNEISYFYNPHLKYNEILDSDVDTLNHYADYMEMWAENEEDFMIDVAKTEYNYAEYLYKSLKELYDYDEEKFIIVEEDDAEGYEIHNHYVTIYSIKNKNETIILEFSAHRTYYAVIDEETKEQLKEFADDKNIEDFMKIVKEELTRVNIELILSFYNDKFLKFEGA